MNERNRNESIFEHESFPSSDSMAEHDTAFEPFLDERLLENPYYEETSSHDNELLRSQLMHDRDTKENNLIGAVHDKSKHEFLSISDNKSSLSNQLITGGTSSSPLRFIKSYRSWFYTIIPSLIMLFLLVAAPFLAVKTFVKGNLQQFSFFVAGFFVVLTLPISIGQVVLHLTNWYMPDVQKYVVRILWMVPIYSIQSWLSLLHETRPLMHYFEPVRDLYEAFVISSFLYYLVALLGGEEELVRTLQTKDAKYGKQIFPFSLVANDWRMGREFMLQCKYGVLLFVVIKICASILMLVLEPLGLYGGSGQNAFNPKRGYVYIAAVLNFSMSWALYLLVKFFYATKEELRSPKNWHPVGKFLCIKGVVFFTFWQGFAIMVMQYFNLIGDIGEWDAKDVRKQLQAMLVCVEMLGFSIAHHFTFTYKEYAINSQRLETSGIEREINSICEDEDGYHAPILRQLDKPMDAYSAFWSIMPDEEFSDFARLRKGAAHAAKAKPMFKDVPLGMDYAQKV